jgi:transcriptional regulator with XRE-family HTH domain
MSMTSDANRLGEFLAARRARVRPEDAGLVTYGRRRVPGLRREELAQLAGVSVDYYVRLEQGRATHPSAEVLDALGRALQLDELEREHLHELGGPARSRPRRRAPRREQARPELSWLLDRLQDVPALVIGRRMDVLAWNRLAAALVADFAAMPERERNLARHVFLDPAARDVYATWDQVAHDTVGVLRRAAVQWPDDEGIEALVGELSVHSPVFARWWAKGEVHEKSHGSKRYVHPLVGELELRYETFTLPGDPGQSLLTYAPEPGTASETALRLLGQLAAETDVRAAQPERAT